MSRYFLERAKRIISINSVTYESNYELVDYLCTLLEPLDVQIELDEGEHFNKPQRNLIVRKGPAEGDALLFNTHLDTVSPGDFSLWDKTGGNPFRATIRENKIYGLGVADVKLDILCKIKALEKFKGTAFRHPFILVGTFGEESGLTGAKQIAASGKIKPKYVVVGEPSNLSIVYAHKGHLVFKVELVDTQAQLVSEKREWLHLDFSGKSVHSSTPALGINAVYNAIECLRRVGPGHRFVSCDGGELVNVIPGKATLWLDGPQEKQLIQEGIQGARETSDQPRYVFSENFIPCLLAIHDLLKKRAQEFRKQPMSEFDPPQSLVSIGVMKTQENRVSLTVGVRTLPNVKTSEWMSDLQSQVSRILSGFPGIEGALNVVRESLPMETSPTSKLVTESQEVLRGMGLQDVVVTKATSTEASIYSRMGAQTIVWGPGVSVDNVHKPNEFNYLHHFEHAIAFYEKLIEFFCVRGVK